MAGLVLGILVAIYFTRPEYAWTAVWSGAFVALLGSLLSNWITPGGNPAVHNFSQIMTVILALMLGALVSAALGAVLGFLALKLIQMLKRDRDTG